MLYVTCPTCGFLLGNKIEKFEEDKKKICSNPKLSKEQQEEEIAKILTKLKLRRYCCKMRIISYKDIVQDIIPLVKK